MQNNEHPKTGNWGELRTGLRNDLQITRQLSRGTPVYVIFDPVASRANRLSLNDYKVVSTLRPTHSLTQAFEQCVREGLLTANDQQEFFDFVRSLDVLGLLSTSQRAGNDLYKSFLRKSQAASKQKYMSLLFMTLPLANPDRFLDRSLHWFSWLYTRTAIVCFAIASLLCVGLVATRWTEFIQPLNGILAIRNLWFAGIAFFALKVWHELGHGYACKKFGGRIPEMGCKLIVGMPLAYVDTTNAWSFPNQAHRLAVMLGGMYFEGLVAVFAILVWSIDPQSFVGSCAYQLVFMAGFATIVFNANPLMRYDGYFILSDLLGIHNLKDRSNKEATQVAKRFFLGMDSGEASVTKTNWWLVSFCALSQVYSAIVLLSITAVIAVRFQAVGLVLIAWQVAMMVAKPAARTVRYLLTSPETASNRPRAWVNAVALVVGLPAVIGLVPIPTGIQIPGVVTAEHSTYVRAETDGIIDTIAMEPGAMVSQGMPLLSLSNIDTTTNSFTTRLTATTAMRNAMREFREDQASGVKLHLQSVAMRQQALDAKKSAQDLTIRAPQDGRLVYVPPQEATGSFVSKGMTVARIVAGSSQIRGWMTAEQLVSADCQVGSPASVYFSDQNLTLQGKVIGISPSKTSEFLDYALTTIGDGDILIDPVSGTTIQALFELSIEVPGSFSLETLQDARANILIGRRSESLASVALRNVLRFINKTISY